MQNSRRDELDVDMRAARATPVPERQRHDYQVGRAILIVDVAPVPLVHATIVAPEVDATTGYSAASDPLTSRRSNEARPAPSTIARPIAARRVPFAPSSHAATIELPPPTVRVGCRGTPSVGTL